MRAILKAIGRAIATATIALVMVLGIGLLSAQYVGSGGIHGGGGGGAAVDIGDCISTVGGGIDCPEMLVAGVDVCTLDGAGIFSGDIVFEGATPDGFELTLSPADPGADVTVTIPAATQTLCGSAGGCAFAASNTYAADDITDADVSNTLTSSLFVGSGSSTTAVDLATAEVAGTLPEANGGTGASTLAGANVCMEAGGSSCNITLNTHSYASSIALDFAATSIDTVTLTGDLTITTSNLAAGRSYALRIVGDGSSRTLTLPSWVFVGAAAPTTIAANKTGLLSLLAFSTTDGSVVAAWAVQP